MLKPKRTLFVAAAAAAALIFTAPAQAAGYYEGKSVLLIVPNTPAGSISRYARLIAPYIQKHSGARDVRVDNQPGAGSLRGTNVLWNAKPDGLTIAFTGLSTLFLAQIAGSPGVQFDAAKFTYLGSVSDDPRVLTVNPKIKSIEEVIKLGRPFVYPSQGTDEDFYTMALLFDALGVGMKPVTGYQGDADTSLAVIKGDGDGHMSSWFSSMGAIKNEEKRPILNMQTKRNPEFPDVPSASEIVKDPQKQAQIETILAIHAVTRGFFGPPNMDPKATEEMREAIKKAMADPDLRADAQKQSMPIAFYDGASEQARAQRIMANGAGLTPILKEALASIK